MAKTLMADCFFFLNLDLYYFRTQFFHILKSRIRYTRLYGAIFEKIIDLFLQHFSPCNLIDIDLYFLKRRIKFIILLFLILLIIIVFIDGGVKIREVSCLNSYSKTEDLVILLRYFDLLVALFFNLRFYF